MAEARTDVSEALKKTALFAGLTPEELKALAARSVRKLYTDGELLFAEGEPCLGFYIVSKGQVRIFKLSPSGREQVLALEGPGSSVAELPVFDGGPYPASASAVGDSEMIFVSRKDFQGFCLEHPEVGLKVIALVGARLRRLVGIIESLSFTTVRQRLVAYLVQMAETGNKMSRGIAMELPSSHQELANHIGTVRELVSRNLTRLQAEGILEVDGRHILIKDLNALKEITERESGG